MTNNYRRNYVSFGLGTIGRDMVYSLISMYLIFYLTDILSLSNNTLWWITGVILFARVFDALNDPIMGVIVDNTKHKYGKFKPWIARGAVMAGILTVLLFTDFGLTGIPFVVLFFVLFVTWGIAWTANDISYWSMLPSLTINQTEREKMGAFARICANIGLFSLVAGIVPLTEMLGNAFGSMTQGYFVFALCVVLIMWFGQTITLIGVKEPKGIFKEQPSTKLSEMFKVIYKNDQLLCVAVSLALFMIGYLTTTSFGLYFFKYAYGDEGMYSIFAIVLGVSQLVALIVFPFFSKRFERKQLFTGATFLVIAGNLFFFFAPMDMRYIGLAGVIMFIGQAFIQLLMLMFLADSIEYGQWKLGKRNESITFSLQPFINKMGGAIGSGIVGAVVIVSGIADATMPSEVSEGGIMLMKSAMLLFPPCIMFISYLIYRLKYKIDKTMYDKIISDLKERGEITQN